MILITFGSHKISFPRFLKEISNKLFDIYNFDSDIFIQLGNNDFIDTNLKINQFRFIPYLEFLEIQKKSDLIISHAGVGTIMEGLRLNKKIISFPRYASLNEHVDDHQLYFSEKMAINNYIMNCNYGDNLFEKLKDSKNFQFKNYIFDSGLVNHLLSKINL